jgi:hypothetical protein
MQHCCYTCKTSAAAAASVCLYVSALTHLLSYMSTVTVPATATSSTATVVLCMVLFPAEVR